MHKWGLSVQRGKYSVVLYDEPFWVHVGQRLIPCAHRLGKPFWSIPLGRPKRDTDDGYLDNSIAGQLISAEDAIAFWFDRHIREVAKVDITEWKARKIDPEFVEIFDDED